MPYLFSYGTLQKEEVQRKLFGRNLDGLPTSLKGYKATPIEIRDEEFLSKGEESNQLIALPSLENDRIEGTLFEVTDEELALADSYEPVDYKRIKVLFESGKEGWIYTSVQHPIL